MANVSQQQNIETEEDLLTCLHIKLYHPQQASRGFYALLPLENRSKHPAEDPLRLGRDSQACTFALVDPRVSRKQLAVQAYRAPRSADLLFSVQNLTQRGRLCVNGAALDYLERTDLPDKALIRFGGYEMLVIREPGDAKGSFEVAFEVLNVPPSRETGTWASTVTPVTPVTSVTSITPLTPVTESSSLEDYPTFNRGPSESDETVICNS